MGWGLIIIDLISQICISLSVTNAFFAFFFYKKHKNSMNRQFFYLVFVTFLNIFLVGFSLAVLSAFFPAVTGYEIIHIMGFSGNIVTITVLLFVIRNLYFLGVDLGAREPAPLWRVVAASAAAVLVPVLVIRDLSLVFRVLFIMLLGTGVLHVINYFDLLRRFVKDYARVESYIIRKASFFLFLIAGIFIPLMYSVFTLDYVEYVRVTPLTQYILDTIGKTQTLHSLRFHVPVLAFHLFFHGFSIFMIARYYFRSHSQTPESLTLQQAEQLNLSRREIEIANLILKGLNNKHIRERLFIADGTLRNHISSIYQKTQVKSREEFISQMKMQ